MTSHLRGIDGFVMPPSWLSPDIDPPWVGKKCWKPLFQNRLSTSSSMVTSNILMDLRTLQVKALIDFEYAGFYPIGMEN